LELNLLLWHHNSILVDHHVLSGIHAASKDDHGHRLTVGHADVLHWEVGLTAWRRSSASGFAVIARGHNSHNQLRHGNDETERLEEEGSSLNMQRNNMEFLI
jgi:hypothetical protein